MSGDELLQPLTATLSSEHGGHPATNCIDGDMTNICHSREPAERSPWLAIDYGTSVTVNRVEIFNRNIYGNRLKNVDVRVSNELPTSADQMFSGGSLFGHLAGPATNGQHIIISGQWARFHSLDIRINVPSRASFVWQICHCPNG